MSTEDTSEKLDLEQCNAKLIAALTIINSELFGQNKTKAFYVNAKAAITGIFTDATPDNVFNNIDRAINVLNRYKSEYDKALEANNPENEELKTLPSENRIDIHIKALEELKNKCTPKPTDTTKLDDCTKQLITQLQLLVQGVVHVNFRFIFAVEAGNDIRTILDEAKSTSGNAVTYIQRTLSILDKYEKDYEAEREIKPNDPNLKKLYEESVKKVDRYIASLTTLMNNCVDGVNNRERSKPASSSTTPTPTPTGGASTTGDTSKSNVDDPVNFDICSKPSPDRWGVRFRYNVGSNAYNNGSGTSCGDNSSSSSSSVNTQHAGFKHEWFLTLLPAMRSTLSANGSVDTPGALPGLQFQIKSNIAKHKIPGFQPVFQHLGVDSIIITMVGTFTGDGGLGTIYKVDKEGDRLKGEEGANMQDVVYMPWAALRKGHPDSDEAINPIHNKTIPTHNRALRQTISYENGEIKQASWNPYNTSNPGWNGNVDKNQYFPSSDVAWETPQMYMTKNLLRAGMFDRDGCPGECPPPDVSETSYDQGRLNITQQQRMIGVNQDVAAAYTLRELSAYLDSYHEFTSFYKVAMHEARELEIEINLRKNNDGLMPKQNKFLQYGREALGILRNDSGNPSFKGIVKDLRVYHARTDRTWYMMDIEVTDYGMANNVPINLTNNLEASTKKALEELAIKQKKEGTKSSINDTEACGNAILKNGNNVYFRISRTVVDADGSYYVVDLNTGFGTFAIKKNGDYTYVANEKGGSILDPKEALLYALDKWGEYLGGNWVNEFKEAFREGDYSKNLNELLDKLIFTSSLEKPNYSNTPLQNITSLKKVRTLPTAVYIDTSTGWGIEDEVFNNPTVIEPRALLRHILNNRNVNRLEDVLAFVNIPSIKVEGQSTSLKGCTDETPSTSASNTSSPTADNTSPATPSTTPSANNTTPLTCSEKILQSNNIYISERRLNNKVFILDVDTGVGGFFTRDSTRRLSNNGVKAYPFIHDGGKFTTPKESALQLINYSSGSGIKDALMSFRYKPIEVNTIDANTVNFYDYNFHRMRNDIISVALLPNGYGLVPIFDTDNPNRQEIIDPDTLIKKYLLDTFNFNKWEDLLLVIGNPNVEVEGSSSIPPECNIKT